MGFNLIDLCSNLEPFERVISNVGRCFSIPLSKSPLCVPRMLWTKCCFAAMRCSSTSLLSASVGLQLMLLQRIAFIASLPSPSRFTHKRPSVRQLEVHQSANCQ